MSDDLADELERDMSASAETAERARRARRRGAALGVDWERALAVYYARENRNPERLVRFTLGDDQRRVRVPADADETVSDDDEQESTTP